MTSNPHKNSTPPRPSLAAIRILPVSSADPCRSTSSHISRCQLKIGRESQPARPRKRQRWSRTAQLSSSANDPGCCTGSPSYGSPPDSFRPATKPPRKAFPADAISTDHLGRIGTLTTSTVHFVDVLEVRGIPLQSTCLRSDTCSQSTTPYNHGTSSLPPHSDAVQEMHHEGLDGRPNLTV